MTEYVGAFTTASEMRFAIVVSRFNEMITRGLLQGALDAAARYGIPQEQVTVVWVPGAYEIPVVAKKLAESGQYDSVICLGAVLRGTTTHFEHVSQQAAAGITRISLDTGIPVIFGVLTLETLEQGFERAGTRMGNKGFEALQTAIETVDVLRQIEHAGKKTRQRPSKVAVSQN